MCCCLLTGFKRIREIGNGASNQTFIERFDETVVQIDFKMIKFESEKVYNKQYTYNNGARRFCRNQEPQKEKT